jgi:GTP cyclohydrolase I
MMGTKMRVAGGMIDETIRHGDVDRPDGKIDRLTEIIGRMMIQLDPDIPRRSTNNTPVRVARMFVNELTAGYDVDIEDLFTAVFPSEGYDGMVAVHEIAINSMCEHHWLPIHGFAHVGYLPEESVLGLSKVARVVDAYARRFQLQERLTKQVADAFEKHLEPKGVMVVIEAEHLCLSVRGAQKPGTITTTSAVRGAFADPSTGARDEFMRLIGK